MSDTPRHPFHTTPDATGTATPAPAHISSDESVDANTSADNAPRPASEGTSRSPVRNVER